MNVTFVSVRNPPAKFSKEPITLFGVSDQTHWDSWRRCFHVISPSCSISTPLTQLEHPSILSFHVSFKTEFQLKFSTFFVQFCRHSLVALFLLLGCNIPSSTEIRRTFRMPATLGGIFMILLQRRPGFWKTECFAKTEKWCHRRPSWQFFFILWNDAYALVKTGIWRHTSYRTSKLPFGVDP